MIETIASTAGKLLYRIANEDADSEMLVRPVTEATIERLRIPPSSEEWF